MLPGLNEVQVDRSKAASLPTHPRLISGPSSTTGPDPWGPALLSHTALQKPPVFISPEAPEPSAL